MVGYQVLATFLLTFQLMVLGEWEESAVGTRLKEFSSTTFKAEYSFSLSKCKNIGNKTQFRKWLPTGKPRYQVKYKNKQTFETLKQFF